MSRRLRNYLLAGLIVVLPAIVSLYILYLSFNLLDHWFRALVLFIFPGTTWSFPGLGLFISLTAILLIGWLTTNMLGRRLLDLNHRLFSRTPIVRSIYNTVKQIIDAFLQQSKTAFQQVVMIQYPREGIWSLGFVTGTARGEIARHLDEETITVFVPTTPNPTSGLLVLVPKKDVIYLKMTVDTGLKLIISGGVFTPPAGDTDESGEESHDV